MICPSIHSTRQREECWERTHNNLICFSLVSYSFFVSFSSGWAVQEELCLFYNEELDPSGSYLLWAAVEPKKNEFWTLWENRFVEIHRRWCSRSIYSSETRAFITLPRPMNPAVFPRGLASALPAKRGPSCPSSLLRKPLAQSGLTIQRLIIQHPGFCRHSATFWPLHCLLPEGRQQEKLKELNHEPIIVATTEQTEEWLGRKGGRNSCPRWSFCIFWEF